jgi:tetratricopeptide (TPR) repeat protein
LSGKPSENRVVRALWRCALWLALAVSSYWALRLAWADRLSDGAGLAGRERAVQLAPAVAVFSERLADRRDELGGDGLPDWRRAAALDPENPERRMRLGVRAELAGDYPMAERSLLAAAARSRLYQPKYLLAQYYFRRQNEAQFWPWAHAALEASWGDAAPVFELAWRMRGDAAWLSANLVPPRREMARQYLAYLTNRERWDAAAAEARQILPAAEGADLACLLAYGEARLARGDAAEAAEIWNALCRRRLLALAPLDPAGDRLVTNGDFLQAPSGRGFDWRLVEQRGVSAAADSGELRVGFTGRQPERCLIAWQYVPTAPDTRYRLRWEARAGLGEPARGIAWVVSDAELGAESAYSQEFLAGRDLTRICLIYQRPSGSARLEDTVWIGHVRLERAP